LDLVIDKEQDEWKDGWQTLFKIYLKELERLGNREKAVESIKKKFFDQICAAERDTYFFMGTTFPYNSWVVIGVYWPPKEYQLELGFE